MKIRKKSAITTVVEVENCFGNFSLNNDLFVITSKQYGVRPQMIKFSLKHTLPTKDGGVVHIWNVA